MTYLVSCRTSTSSPSWNDKQDALLAWEARFLPIHRWFFHGEVFGFSCPGAIAAKGKPWGPHVWRMGFPTQKVYEENFVVAASFRPQQKGSLKKIDSYQTST